MKEFTVLKVNRKENRAEVIDTIKANSERDARVIATTKHFYSCDPFKGDTLVVASKKRFNRIKNMVVEANK